MRVLAGLIVVGVLAAGCGGPALTTEQKLNSSAGVERAQGIMEAGERRDWNAIPTIIDRLMDDDVSVRIMAGNTLRDMTGQKFDYNAYADEPQRREAAGRWRSWWNETGSRQGAAAAAGSGGTP